MFGFRAISHSWIRTDSAPDQRHGRARPQNEQATMRESLMRKSRATSTKKSPCHLRLKTRACPLRETSHTRESYLPLVKFGRSEVVHPGSWCGAINAWWSGWKTSRTVLFARCADAAPRPRYVFRWRRIFGLVGRNIYAPRNAATDEQPRPT